VPQECLILTMQQNQKYFPLLDSSGKLLNRFLIVSNMQVDDPAPSSAATSASCARVWRMRASSTTRTARTALPTASFASARWSITTSSARWATAPSAWAASRAFHRRKLGADAHLAERAALFAKIDLLTDMVGEFPELQGIMGRYYLLHEGGLPVVADAIEQHYRPRFAGDALPQGNIACAAALADKLDALVGFFGIGQLPTGDKDPFGLRRAALGVLRILMETPLPLDLGELIGDAQQGAADAGNQLEAVDEPLLTSCSTACAACSRMPAIRST
jgi:glycyl-tRNA synthetase beta chain